MNVATRTRAFAAALTFGATLLSLAPGQAAYAAGSNPREIVRIAIADPGAGSGPEDPASNAERKRKHPVNTGVWCSITHPDGSIDLYLPGDAIVRDGKILVCGEDGTWGVLPRSGGAGGVGSPTTGTNAP
jgi:hypothetical protein